MTTIINEKTYEFRGLSTDIKPMEKAGNGSVFIEMDTGKVYIFDEENLIWIELSKKSGDSDTGSGESGGGANITSNIKIVANKNDILSTSDHNKLCILSITGDLSFKVVDKIEGGSEEISTLSEVLPQNIRSSCSARYNDNIYIFGGYGSNGRVNTIYKFNCTNKTISILTTTLLQALMGACCSVYNDNIFIFGGYGSSNVFNTIYKFNCATETLSKLSATLPKVLYGACCSVYNDNIFIFGGSNGNSYSNTIYKFNCATETITTLSATLPNILMSACCSIYKDNIYIFGGSNGDMLKTIYKFNCSSETISILSTTLPKVLYEACCSCYGNSVYIFGGYSTSGYLNTIYNFSVTFDLPTNNVLIYNANSKYSFDLITDQVTIPIKNIYIGDSNNTAQLANAYLYDEMQTAWVNVNTGEVLS